MAETSSRIKFEDYAFYVVVFFIALATWGTQTYMKSRGEEIVRQQSGGVYGDPDTVCKVPQKQEMDAFLEVNRLLTTLGTTLLGAVFYLLSSGSEKIDYKQRRWAAVAGMTFVAISIFFGYVAYSFFISVLQDGTCDVTSSYPHWAQQAHFYTFLLGVIFLGDFTYCNLMRRNEPVHAEGKLEK